MRKFLTNIEAPDVSVLNAPVNPTDVVRKLELGPLNSHVADTSIHFPINDGGNGFSETFSANYSRSHFDDRDLHFEMDNILGTTERRPFYYDSVRDKWLSCESLNFMWSETRITSNDWVKIGEATGARIFHINNFPSTLVGYTLTSENASNSTDDIRLYRNSTFTNLITLPGTGFNTFVTESLNIDLNAGERLRLRAESGFSPINDAVIMLQVKVRRQNPPF